MSTTEEVVVEATFTPKIKAYTLIRIALIFLASVIGIVLLPFWFLGVGQYYSRRYYANIKCDLTTKHLRFNKGVLFRVEKTIPLENIQNLTFIENPLLKVLELKILKIETAAQGHPQSSDMKLVGIKGASEFKDHVLAQRSLLMTQESSGGTSSDSSEVLAALKDIHGVLKEIRDKED